MAVEEPAAAAPPAGLADRLGGSHVGVRRDLEVSRHVFRGEVAYVVRDPMTFATHRIGGREYRLFNAIDEDVSLAETFASFVERGLMAKKDEEPFYRFVMSLHRMGFLKLPIQDDEALYERHVSRLKAKRRGLWTMLFSAQVPLFNPDAFLTRTMRFVRPLFSTPALVAWCALVLVAVLAGVRNAAEFSAPVVDIFSGPNLPLLWGTLVALKVFHEFGHAYACKLYGGRVPEMGLMIIAGAPLAYMDASSSWSFPDKRKRILVCLGGMYIEVALAAAAMLLWCATPPGVLRSVLHNVVMLASVTTVMMNINPLMRYDGYYALTDLLELPNLRGRANDHSVGVLKRILLGIPNNTKGAGFGLRTFFLIFGIASAIYKVTVVLGISAVIATKYVVAGALLGGAYMANSLWGVLKKSLPYLLKSEETQPLRVRAVAVALVFFAALPLALFAVPVPSSVRAPAVVASRSEEVLRAQTAGFLDDLHVAVGERIPSGAPILELSDPAAGSELEEARARQRSAEIQARALLVDDPLAAADHQLLAEQAAEDAAFWAARLAAQAVTAKADSLVLWSISPADQGRWVEAGEMLVRLSPEEHPCTSALALFHAADVAGARPEAGQRVQFQPASRPDLRLPARVVSVTPAGSRELEPVFKEHLDMASLALDPTTGLVGQSQFVVELRIDEEPARAGWNAGYLAPGLSGQLRMDAEPAPLGLIAVRKLLVFLAKL